MNNISQNKPGDEIPNKRRIAKRVMDELVEQIHETCLAAVTALFTESEALDALMRFGIFAPEELDAMLQVAAEEGLRRVAANIPVLDASGAPEWEDGEKPQEDFISREEIEYPSEEEDEE